MSDTARTQARRPREANGRYAGKLTRDLISQVCTALYTGATLEDASAIAGISRSTLQEWLRAGRAGDGRPLEIELAVEVERALAHVKARLSATVVAHADKDWRAAAWTLERRFPAEFGQVNRVDVEAKHEHRHVIDLSALSDDELEIYERLLTKARQAAETIDGEVIELEPARRELER